MKKKQNDFEIMDEILLETEDELREVVLQEASLKSEIQRAKKELELETEKKDPNRSIFYAVNNVDYEKQTDKIQEEIFEKKQKLDSINESKKQLEDRKQKLLQVMKAVQTQSQQEKNANTEDTITFLDIQEQERLRIANDLHDSTVQTLTALIHKIELVEKLFEVDQGRAKIELIGMSEVLRGAIQEIRDTIFNLRQSSLSELGLWSSIRDYVEKIQRQSTIQTKVKIDESLEEIPIEKTRGTILYKMLQEVITNSVKHSNASGIEVIIKKDNEMLHINVTDDGVGMKKEDMDKSGNYGLQILKERTKLLSGEMEINTNRKGTEIKFLIPLLENGGL